MMGKPTIEHVNLKELINLQKEFNRYNYDQICNFSSETFVQIFFKRACATIYLLSVNDYFHPIRKFFT